MHASIDVPSGAYDGWRKTRTHAPGADICEVLVPADIADSQMFNKASRYKYMSKIFELKNFKYQWVIEKKIKKNDKVELWRLSMWW